MQYVLRFYQRSIYSVAQLPLILWEHLVLRGARGRPLSYGVLLSFS